MIVLVVIICILIGVSFYSKKQWNKQARLRINKKYGQIPDKKDNDYNSIGLFWQEIVMHQSKETLIDDITWHDLDMDPIYEKINNTNSYVGEQLLYSMLHEIIDSKQKLDEVESKINFFENFPKQREYIQMNFMKLGKQINTYNLPLFLNNLDAFKLDYQWIYRVLQIILVGLAFCAGIFRNNTSIAVFVGGWLINLSIYALHKKKFEVQLESIQSIAEIISLAKLLCKGKKCSYEEKYCELTENVLTLEKLFKYLGGLQTRKMLGMSGDFVNITALYLTGAFMIDFISYNKAITELKNNLDNFLDLYSTIGKIDALIAVSSFRKSLEKFCIPIIKNNIELSLDNLYHPLIENAICNTIDLKNNSIITGANASGKSTFIKAVTINVILAQTIHTCTADNVILPFSNVVASMAVRDNLLQGESYYMKEIKSLNRIIKSMDNGKPVICAIDEILRGTGTKERIAASAAILKYLNKRKCLVLVASHDLELTVLLENEYDNYYFCEHMQEIDIAFDYKIHKGINKKTNAIKLLEFVGFPEEIIRTASEIYKVT